MNISKHDVTGPSFGRMRKPLFAVADPEFTRKDLQEEMNVCFFS
jgi:hypothetical protein